MISWAAGNEALYSPSPNFSLLTSVGIKIPFASEKPY